MRREGVVMRRPPWVQRASRLVDQVVENRLARLRHIQHLGIELPAHLRPQTFLLLAQRLLELLKLAGLLLLILL